MKRTRNIRFKDQNKKITQFLCKNIVIQQKTQDLLLTFFFVFGMVRILMQDSISIFINFSSIQLKMYDFVEIDELSSNSHHHHKPQKQNHHQLHNYYNELESEFSANPQEEIQEDNAGETHLTQKEQTPAPKFKLTLPTAPEPDTPEKGNINIKKKRVLVEPAESPNIRQSKTNEKLIIYDLEDEIEEQVAENIQYSIMDRSGKVLLNQSTNLKNNESELQDNSFLDIQKETIVPTPAIIIPEKQPEVVNNSTQFLNEDNQKSRLFTKVFSIEAPIGMGAFASKQTQNDDYIYDLKDSTKKSVDSGLQVTSVYSSRDELSTRNILPPIFQEKSKRFKLPELKPYKQVLEDNKVFELPSQNLLKEEEVQKPKAAPPKNRAKIPRSRQVVIKGIEINNVGQFVKSPVAYGKRLECTLVRNKSCSNRYFLDYDLMTTDGRFLMSCKKMAFCLTSTYHFSLANGSYSQKGDLFLGRVKGNFVGSIFNLYTFHSDSFQQMEMIATICYSSDFSCCSEKCRELEIYVKNEDYKYYELEGTELEKGKNLKDLYQVESNRSLKRITKYVNKQPRWIPEAQVFALNFHGKSKHASVKNTIIVQEDKPQNQVALIAKQEDNKFAFEVSYPFSPFIAFGAMITGFDFKLASQ